jgi:hypothetical protein
MASNGGFAISVGVQDAASARLDAINRRIAAMQAPAERFNKSLARFGDVTGINRAAEGMQALGDRSLGAARAVERLATPMGSLGALIGAGSIAGIAAFSRQWAEAGNQIGKTAYLLNAPVETVSALRGAARLAGSTAEAMDGSLEGLNKTLNAAKWQHDPHAVKTLNQLGIGFEGAGGQARKAADVLGDVADKVASYSDPHAQQHILESLGMSPDLLPLLKDGRKGLQAFLSRAQETGGVMTGQMAKNGAAMRSSWEELGLAIEGVANRVEDKWAPSVQHAIDLGAKWIEKNKEQADSVAQVGGAVAGAFTLWKASGYLPWMVRALGLAAAGEEMLYYGTRMGQTQTQEHEDAILGGPASKRFPEYMIGPATPYGLGEWWQDHVPAWLGGRSAVPPIKAPAVLSAAAAVMQRSHDFFRAKGLTEEQTAGVLVNIAAESGFDPDRSGDEGTSYGLFQDHAGRLAKLRAKYGARPTADQQLDFAWDELNGPEKAVLDRLRHVNTAGQSGAVFTGFERPADGQGEAWRRGQAADQFMPHPGGSVTIDVNLRGAPAGTTATVTSAGAVDARPPRVETSMPGAR